MGDIRRQRHLSKLVQNFLEDAVELKTNQAVAFVYHIDHFRLQQAVTEIYTRAGSGFLSGLYQSLPYIVGLALQKQYFNMRAGVFFDSQETGRYNFCVIDHQAVTRVQVVNNVSEDLVLDAACLFIQYHEPGAAAVLQRILGYELLG